MKKRIILIPKDDIVKYPPTISLINALLDLGIEVECVGRYSDEAGRESFEKRGVKFVDIFRNIKDESKYRIVNWIIIIKRMREYTKAMKHYFETANITENDLVWFIYSSSIAQLQPYIEKYNYVVQFYEFENFAIDGKSKLLHPSYDVYRFLNKAKALVHCEYNRAVITNGLYGLNKEYFILPNKPYEGGFKKDAVVPADVVKIISDLRAKLIGKKIILYQGIFDPHERRLDDFCEAVPLLPDEYVFVAMGNGGSYFEAIKRKYSSDRILFLPFIRPPFHLEITKLASFGVLAYYPAAQNYVDVLNPLYCAPNKIFEFGKFGIPMIANDVPGLKMIFETYKCGATITYPLTSEKIANTVLSMNEQYDTMSTGSKAYYDSVDIKKTIQEILDSVE